MKRIIAVATMVAATHSVVYAQTPLNLPIAPGKYQPTLESLQQYECPTWYRDAKFGIWAHWGPQSVPMDGDWYARGMYEQGSGHYNYHIANYGHPSVFGYKDIIPLWKAEKWDPDRLMKLYKDAGAKYFVSMGTHHDNFFLWNSKLHRWNAVNMGPHRDVVGDWQKAAKKNGLRFGVSEHLAASFTWFQGSHGSDKTGPKAGVPYDGADPQYQDLYHFPAEPGDNGWMSNNPKWQQQWFNEIKELVDNYHPDLLYSDSGVPFGNEVGRSLIAHLYNSDAARHGGHVEAIYNCKEASNGRWVSDIERGIRPTIDKSPWQTDTSIGDWFYNRNWKYRPITWVVHTLVDNVSKNGNLLLNVVQRPDGSIDPEVEQMLKEMSVWSKINGEAIFGTRPWTVYGEGTVKAKGGSFKEDYTYSAKDIRFTTKGKTLYAIALGWPKDNVLTIRSLAKATGSPANTISNITLLGYKGKLEWSQNSEGLSVKLPTTPISALTTALKIQGTQFQPSPIPEVVSYVRPDATGIVTLSASSADVHGEQIKVEENGTQSNIGYWDRANEWASWNVTFPAAGAYQVSAQVASLSSGSELVLETANQKLPITVPDTGNWQKYTSISSGTLTIPQAGNYVIYARPRDAATWKPINLQSVVLTPVH